MLYADLQPVTFEAHGELGLLPSAGYGFARAVSVVPVHAYELRRLVPVLPLVIDMGEAVPAVKALTGVRTGQNLFVGPKGGWGGAVVPEVLQDHPFAVGMVAAQRGVLQLDQASDRLVRDGGEPLFTADGEPGEVLRVQRDALARRIRDRVATAQAIRLLEDNGLLEPWGAEDVPALDPERHRRAEPNGIEALDDATRLQLLDTGAIALAHAQAHSRANLLKLRRMAERRGPDKALEDVLGYLDADDVLDFSNM